MTGLSTQDALAALTKNRLRGLANALDLAAPARARKAELIEALARSRAFQRTLELLSRNELKAVCRALGLDDSGREKAKIINRICRSGIYIGDGETVALSGNGDAQTHEPLTLDQLERHLWESANILRGKIDSSDFKHFIFGLLFFKRLCDVWEEEFSERLRRYGDPQRAADPTEHRFHLPPHAAWKAVRQHKHNIGRHLNAALRAIEQTNLALAGVFQDVNFDNQERFPDATLELLLDHFEIHRLRNSDVEPDMLGNAYEYVIGQFADDAGKKGGEFYTPKQVVRLIVECLQPREGMSIYDPACGSGGMLLETVRFLERRGADPKTLELCGQEMNLNTWAICQMNLFLHDIDEAQVVRGDTLRHPKHIDRQNRLRHFDRVLANPPFSLKKWGHKEWSTGDAFGRDIYGCPPPSYGDLAFVQHMVASLAHDGMLGVVVPHGILYRRGGEEAIRRGLIEDDLIEAIIGLAPNLFYGTGISACVLIINRRKQPARRGRVLFVQGDDEHAERKNQNRLSDANVQRLADTYHAFEDHERFARVVDLDEIRANDHNLNISRYVNTAPVIEPVDMPTAIQRQKVLRAQRSVAEDTMMEHLANLGYEV